MEDSGHNYVIAGSSANALLTYFFRPDLLHNLSEPDDGDFIVIPDNFSRVSNFSSEGLKKIGNYITYKPNEKSSSFNKTNKSDFEFNSIDINLENSIKYIIVEKFKIINPTDLNIRYTENFRQNKNSNKVTVLTEVLKSEKLNQYTIKTFNTKKKNNRNSFVINKSIKSSGLFN